MIFRQYGVGMVFVVWAFVKSKVIKLNIFQMFNGDGNLNLKKIPPHIIFTLVISMVSIA